MAARYAYYVRDRSNRRRGQLEPRGSVEIALRHNAAASWSLAIAETSRAARLIAEGWGIIVTRDDVPFLSGPLTALEEDGGGLLQLEGQGDELLLADRFVAPNPAGPPYDALYDERTGTPEALIHYYVNANAGPTAPNASMRIPGLQLYDNANRGASITERPRFANLLEYTQYLALLAGIGFRVLQEGDVLAFRTFALRDRTREAVFSRELGNLGALGFRLERPEMNWLAVRGQGVGSDKIYVYRSDDESRVRWGRINGFIDMNGSTLVSELQQRAEQEIIERAERASLTLSPRDTARLQYARDYRVGDRVTVRTLRGAIYTETLGEVRLSLSEAGEQFTPVIVGPGGKAGGAMVRLLRDLARRVSYIERTR